MKRSLLVLCAMLCLSLCACTGTYVESPVDAAMGKLDEYEKNVEQGLGKLDEIMQESAATWQDAG